MEILKEKMDVMREIQDYVGVYFSKEYIKKSILRFSDEELREMDRQMEEEVKQEPQEQSEDDLGEI